MKRVPKILLTSVYTPYIKCNDYDDDTDFFYQKNTVGQKMFTMKQVHHWHPLHYIAQNIIVDSLVLENPTWKDFVNELSSGDYDIIAITFTIKSVNKTIDMLRYISDNFPNIETVIGGYGTTMLKEDNKKSREIITHATYISYGEGLEFFQNILKEKWGIDSPKDTIQKFIPSDLNFRYTSIPIHRSISFLYSLGCNNRCSFCTTTFKYNCKKVRVLSAEQLYKRVLAEVKSNSSVKSGIIYDEDFLENKKEFLDFMELVSKDSVLTARRCTFFAFASVRSIEQYSVEELVKARIGTLFIGVESLTSSVLESEQLPKRGKKEIQSVFDDLHNAGINTIGSTIIGWDEQSSETIDVEMENYVKLNASLTQIIPLTAFPGTKLWDDLKAEGRVDSNYDFDNQIFGYSSVDYISFTKDEVKETVTKFSKKLLSDCGPWVFKYCVNYYNGYKRYKNSDDEILLTQSDNYEKMFKELLPLALVSILFFYGRGFQKRWIRFVGEIFPKFPLYTIFATIIGTPVSIVLYGFYVVNRLYYTIFSKEGEQPTFEKYYYRNRKLQHAKLQ